MHSMFFECYLGSESVHWGSEVSGLSLVKLAFYLSMLFNQVHGADLIFQNYFHAVCVNACMCVCLCVQP